MLRMKGVCAHDRPHTELSWTVIAASAQRSPCTAGPAWVVQLWKARSQIWMCVLVAVNQWFPH